MCSRNRVTAMMESDLTSRLFKQEAPFLLVARRPDQQASELAGSVAYATPCRNVGRAPCRPALNSYRGHKHGTDPGRVMLTKKSNFHWPRRVSDNQTAEPGSKARIGRNLCHPMPVRTASTIASACS